MPRTRAQRRATRRSARSGPSQPMAPAYQPRASRSWVRRNASASVPGSAAHRSGGVQRAHDSGRGDAGPEAGPDRGAEVGDVPERERLGRGANLDLGGEREQRGADALHHGGVLAGLLATTGEPVQLAGCGAAGEGLGLQAPGLEGEEPLRARSKERGAVLGAELVPHGGAGDGAHPLAYRREGERLVRLDLEGAGEHHLFQDYPSRRRRGPRRRGGPTRCGPGAGGGAFAPAEPASVEDRSTSRALAWARRAPARSRAAASPSSPTRAKARSSAVWPSLPRSSWGTGPSAGGNASHHQSRGAAASKAKPPNQGAGGRASPPSVTTSERATASRSSTWPGARRAAAHPGAGPGPRAVGPGERPRLGRAARRERRGPRCPGPARDRR